MKTRPKISLDSPSLTHTFSVDPVTKIDTPKPALSERKLQKLRDLRPAPPMQFLITRTAPSDTAQVYASRLSGVGTSQLTVSIPNDFYNDLLDLIAQSEDPNQPLSATIMALARFGLDQLNANPKKIYANRT